MFTAFICFIILNLVNIGLTHLSVILPKTLELHVSGNIICQKNEQLVNGVKVNLYDDGFLYDSFKDNTTVEWDKDNQVVFFTLIGKKRINPINIFPSFNGYLIIKYKCGSNTEYQSFRYNILNPEKKTTLKIIETKKINDFFFDILLANFVFNKYLNFE